jgi:hypothetical protein
VRLTVQVVLPDGAKVGGVHANEVNAGAGLLGPDTAPPAPAIPTLLPLGEAAETADIPIEVSTEVGAMVRFTTATMPSGMIPIF